MDNAEHCKEVYAHFGLAMYRAQCVEQSIIQLLIFFDFFKRNVPTYKSQEQWERDFDKFDGNLSSKTFGQLIRNLNDLGAVDSSIEPMLRAALQRRNNLAHKFFVEHALNFLSREGRDNMIAELESCWQFFNEVEDTLNPITYSLCEKYGLTQEKLKEIERNLFVQANGDLPQA